MGADLSATAPPAGHRGQFRRAPLIVLGFATLALIGLVVVAVREATDASDKGGIAVTPAASSVLSIGARVPLAFDLERLGGGGKIALASLTHGRPAVINFFASWCSQCAAELRAFGTVSHDDAQRVAFVGIDTNDSAPGTAQTMLRSARDDYPVARDSSSLAVSTAYGIANLPVTFFLDAAGRVHGEVLGAQTARSLQDRVRALEHGQPLH